MKYTVSETCDCPRDAFVRYLIGPDHLSEWQHTLIRHEAISGETGTEGSQARLINQFGKRKIEIIETIETANLPDTMSVVYEGPGAWNRVFYRIMDTPSGGTTWSMDCEFRCTGTLRVMSLLFPGMFKRATTKEMKNLKAYAEAQSRKETA